MNNTKVMKDEVYQRVIDTYQSGYSVKETAELCHVSSVKARRILITEGLWSSERSEEVRILMERGMKTEEIADALKVTVKAVEAYMPYQRGSYSDELKTQDADRSKQYRQRIQNATRNIMTGEKREVIRMEDSNAFQTMILKIDLANEDDTDGEIERVLYEYGQVYNGNTLSREIVVPDDMPLYALHYCILRAFGFLNEHLHSFTLPQETNEKMFSSVREWLKLCGVLYRSPCMKEDDYFWADDYEKGSFRKWQRSKYTGPYVRKTPGESYEECQNDMEEYLKDYPYIAIGEHKRERWSFPYGIPVEDLNDYDGNMKNIMKMEDCPFVIWNRLFERSCLELRECLTVSEIFHKDSGIDKLLYSYDFGDGWQFEITQLKSHEEVNAREKVICDAEDSCISTHRPVCVSHEGGYLVEDAGGIYGYIQFLRAIHPEEEYHAFMDGTVSYSNNGPYEDSTSSRMWAESLEWTDQPIIDKRLL